MVYKIMLYNFVKYEFNLFFVNLWYILLWCIPYFFIIMRNSLLKTDLLILLSTHQKIGTKTLEKPMYNS